jgi:hypothetical protein
MIIKYKIVALPPHMEFDRNRRLTDGELSRLQEQVNGLEVELMAKPDIRSSFRAFRFLFEQPAFTLPSIKQILHVCFSDYFGLLERYLTDAHLLAVQYRNGGLTGKQGREDKVTPIIDSVAQVFFEAPSIEETAFAKKLVMQAQRIFNGELRVEQRVEAVSYMVEPQGRRAVARYISNIRALETDIAEAVGRDLSPDYSIDQALDDLRRLQMDLGARQRECAAWPGLEEVLRPLFSKMAQSLKDKKASIVLQKLTILGLMPAGQAASPIEALTAQTQDIRTRLQQAGQGMDGLLAAVGELLQTGDESPDPSESGDSLAPSPVPQVSTFTVGTGDEPGPGWQADGRTFVMGAGADSQELAAGLRPGAPLAGIGESVSKKPFGVAADVAQLEADKRILVETEMLEDPRNAQPEQILGYSGMIKAEVPAFRRRIGQDVSGILKRLQAGYLGPEVRKSIQEMVATFFGYAQQQQSLAGVVQDMVCHNPVPDVGVDELNIAGQRKLAVFLVRSQFREKKVFHFEELLSQEFEDVVRTLTQERRQVAAAFNQEISIAVDNAQDDYAQVLTKLKFYFERETVNKLAMVEMNLEEGTEVVDIVFAKLKSIYPAWVIQSKEELVIKFSANSSQVLGLEKEEVREFLLKIGSDHEGFPFSLSEIEGTDNYEMPFGTTGQVLYLKDCITHWEVVPSLELQGPDAESDQALGGPSAGSDDVESMGLTGSDAESGMESAAESVEVIALPVLSHFEGETYEFGVAVTNFQEIMCRRLSGQGTELELRQLEFGNFCKLWTPKETEFGRLCELIPVVDFNPENLEAAHEFLVAFLRRGPWLGFWKIEDPIIRSIFGRPQAVNLVMRLLCFDLDKKGGELWTLVLRNWFLDSPQGQELLTGLREAGVAGSDQDIMFGFIKECLNNLEQSFRKDIVRLFLERAMSFGQLDEEAELEARTPVSASLLWFYEQRIKQDDLLVMLGSLGFISEDDGVAQ